MRPIKTFFLFFSLSISFLFAKDGADFSEFEIHYCLGSQKVYAVEVDPNTCTIKPVKAIDNGIGRESVSSLANRHKALAAINGGFFSIGGLFDGRACGTLKIDDWYALPTKPRGCIGWSSQSKSVIFDRLLISVEGVDQSGTFSINGLNCPRKEGQIILFNPLFNRTTLTSFDGEELIVKNGIISDVRKNQGSTKIPEDGYVLSIHRDHPLFDSFSVGNSLSFKMNIAPQDGLTTSEAWENCDYIVGGTPLLIHDFTKVNDFSSELTIPTFITSRHSRSAIGILPSGHWLFVVIDKTGICDGMTMAELADLMQVLGCQYALNLDGGGSSTLVFEEEIKNSPHGDEDEDEGQKIVRRVSDAIVVIPKSK